jgi:formylglycine-generating enzyme required for sulfatase activity
MIVLALAGLMACPDLSLAGGKDKGQPVGEGGASLIIGVSGLDGGSGTMTTTIDGLSKGQTLSVGIEPPTGDPRMDVITLSPGKNRLRFPKEEGKGSLAQPPQVKPTAKARKPAPTAAKIQRRPTTVRAPEPQRRTAQAPAPAAAAPKPAMAPPASAKVAPPVTPVAAPSAPVARPEPAPAPTPAAQDEAPPAKSETPAVPVAEPPPLAPPPPVAADGEGFRDCPECPSMVMVPAGTFVMGAGDPIEDVNKRSVTIAKPFAAGRFEVTYAEWSACVREEACPAHVQPPTGGDRTPVSGVNFGDAKRYVQWLAAKTGKPYRLPSEAEWEYLARAGTSTAFWWGDKAGQGMANCFGCGTAWDGKRAAPVGSFPANAFGLFDTAGNVWEWVEDCFEADAYKTHQGYPAPVAGGGFCDRALRGGGWDIGPTGIRPTFRFGADPQNRFNFYGFRVVRD